MTLTQWADRWNLPQIAMIELSGLLYHRHVLPNKFADKSEDWVSSKVQLESSDIGSRMWRNNVGAMKTENGFLRYGLCNETKAVNEVLKSSDLIGCTPITVTYEHIGRTFGIFTAAETKAQGWTFKGTDREVGQLNYINLVQSIGGIAGFISDEDQFQRMVLCQI
jgi:hypothetical protein